MIQRRKVAGHKPTIEAVKLEHIIAVKGAARKNKKEET
jgi:hypothetical protein